MGSPAPFCLEHISGPSFLAVAQSVEIIPTIAVDPLDSQLEADDEGVATFPVRSLGVVKSGPHFTPCRFNWVEVLRAFWIVNQKCNPLFRHGCYRFVTSQGSFVVLDKECFGTLA